jgi:hypothetical protein
MKHKLDNILKTWIKQAKEREEADIIQDHARVIVED